MACMNSDPKTKKFKELLDQEHTWPSNYVFKFIVPKEKEDEVRALFPNEDVQTKSSNKGTYVSLTIELQVESSDLVIAIYEKASLIDGLMSL